MRFYYLFDSLPLLDSDEYFNTKPPKTKQVCTENISPQIKEHSSVLTFLHMITRRHYNVNDYFLMYFAISSLTTTLT